MFAACGTRLAAARAGTVKFAATDARAGNYVVVSGAGSGLDYVYMHMRSPATVSKGQPVFTGQKIGEVGDSGSACTSSCGRRPAGTPAAARSTRWRSCKPGTPHPDVRWQQPDADALAGEQADHVWLAAMSASTVVVMAPGDTELLGGIPTPMMHARGPTSRT